MTREEHVSEWSYPKTLQVAVLIYETRQLGFIFNPHQTKKEALRVYISRFRKAHPDKYTAIMAKIRLGVA